jgi:hypothetical protein
MNRNAAFPPIFVLRIMEYVVGKAMIMRSYRTIFTATMLIEKFITKTLGSE